jgi:hypothetical protein
MVQAVVALQVRSVSFIRGKVDADENIVMESALGLDLIIKWRWHSLGHIPVEYTTREQRRQQTSVQRAQCGQHGEGSRADTRNPAEAGRGRLPQGSSRYWGRCSTQRPRWFTTTAHGAETELHSDLDGVQGVPHTRACCPREEPRHHRRQLGYGKRRTSKSRRGWRTATHIGLTTLRTPNAVVYASFRGFPWDGSINTIVESRACWKGTSRCARPSTSISACINYPKG